VTIHDGGWILTLTGSKGTFGGNARVEATGAITRGQLSYQDHSTLTPITFHSIQVVAIVCRSETGGQSADVYGTGRVNGVGPVDFRIRVSDRGEPGSKPAGPDTYQIITAAYASGPEENPLQGGNVQIHRWQ
jgi:hypothetical protein